MRNLVFAVALPALLLGGCNSGLLGSRERPDEFAVARQAPLVVPPDFALVPPQPGAPRPQDRGASNQALDALFGGTAQRSASESATISAAGADVADPGIRSGVGSPDTVVVDKGSTTRDIVAAPEGDGREASAGAGTQATTPPPQS
jgi:hypothetical protein